MADPLLDDPDPETAASLRARWLREVDQGRPVAALLVEDVAPRLRAVGEAWLHGRWGVAAEHRESAAVDGLLVELELRTCDQQVSGPRVLCVAAEGDWHSLPTRLVQVVLRSIGFDPVCLTPSLPARDLVAAVEELQPELVTISCSTVAALPGAARCLEAVAGGDVPVLSGGFAFGSAPAARSAFGAPEVSLLDLPTAAVGASPGSGAFHHEAVAQLDLVSPVLCERAAASLPPHPALEEGVGLFAGILRGAVLLGAPVSEDHRRWLATFLAAREAPADEADVRLALREAAERTLEDPTPVAEALLDRPAG